MSLFFKFFIMTPSSSPSTPSDHCSPSSGQKSSSLSYGKMAFFTWLVTSLFYAFQFFLRSAPNSLQEQLMKDFAIDSAAFGLFSSAYYWSYSFLQIPVGAALDLLGPKKMLRFGTSVCVLGAIIFALSPNFSIAILGRFLLGAGAAVSFIGSVRMNTLWVTGSYLAFAIGSLTAMGKILGGAASVRYLKDIIALMPNWHQAVLLLCAIGAFFVVMLWIFAKNGPEDHFEPNIKHFSMKNIGQELFGVIREPMLWKVGLYGYALYLSLSVIGDTYSTGFFSQRLGVSKDVACGISSWILLGSAAGAPFLSFLSDFIKRRKPILMVSSFFVVVLAYFVFYGPSCSIATMKILTFLFGFFAGGQALIFAIAVESVGIRRAGMALGLVNCLLMFGGAMHNPLVGFILKKFWTGETLNDIPLYHLSNYQLAFLSVYVMFILAFLLSFFMKESHQKRQQNSLSID